MTESTSHEVETLTIRIPMQLQRRGRRKLIIAPETAAVPAPKPARDDTLIKALVRAHRWRRRIESGRAKSITDLAEQEGVTDAYVCRLLPLTCLAPDILEASIDGRQPKGLRLAEILGNGPLGWDEQRSTWGSPGPLRRADHSAVCSGIASSASSREDRRIHRRTDQEGAMCRLSSSEYDLYRRTSVKPGRSLFGWLRDLWRPRRPQVEEAEVVPFPAEAAVRADQEADRRGSRAA
jgi:hypothetical protein